MGFLMKLKFWKKKNNTDQRGRTCVHQGSTDLRCINVMLFRYITPISHVVYNKKETFHASNIHNVEYNTEQQALNNVCTSNFCVAI